MTDDKNKLDYKDRTKINMYERHEVDYWCEKFGVTPRKLKEAVLRAGPSVKAVERLIEK